jgi:hypothetical protein
MRIWFIVDAIVEHRGIHVRFGDSMEVKLLRANRLLSRPTLLSSYHLTTFWRIGGQLDLERGGLDGWGFRQKIAFSWDQKAAI